MEERGGDAGLREGDWRAELIQLEGWGAPSDDKIPTFQQQASTETSSAFLS
jgi:hypothetical protein